MAPVVAKAAPHRHSPSHINPPLHLWRLGSVTSTSSGRNYPQKKMGNRKGSFVIWTSRQFPQLAHPGIKLGDRVSPLRTTNGRRTSGGTCNAGAARKYSGSRGSRLRNLRLSAQVSNPAIR